MTWKPWVREIEDKGYEMISDPGVVPINPDPL